LEAPLHDRRNNCGHERAHEHDSLNANKRKGKQKVAVSLITMAFRDCFREYKKSVTKIENFRMMLVRVGACVCAACSNSEATLHLHTWKLSDSSDDPKFYLGIRCHIASKTHFEV
jgi:hypothetical protein